MYIIKLMFSHLLMYLASLDVVVDIYEQRIATINWGKTFHLVCSLWKQTGKVLDTNRHVKPLCYWLVLKLNINTISKSSSH